MRMHKIWTNANLVLSVFGWVLFGINQLCNLRFLGLWTVWCISGYGFALLVGPVSAMSALVCAGVCCFGKGEPERQNQYIGTNVICAVVTGALLFCCFVIRGTLTWA